MVDETTAASPVESEQLVVVLTKPVLAHGDEIKEIKLREPTGNDIVACGSPVKIDWNTEPPSFDINVKPMEDMMVRLAGVPASTIKSLAPRDWMTVAWRVAPFFLPRMGPPPTQ